MCRLADANVPIRKYANYEMPQPGIPESLNVLLHELRGLGLSINLE